MLAGLRDTLIHIILTVVTSVASWTLCGTREGHTALRNTNISRHTYEDTESQHKRTHTDGQYTETCLVDRTHTHRHIHYKEIYPDPEGHQHMPSAKGHTCANCENQLKLGLFCQRS
jgi:hypothetical protein